MTIAPIRLLVIRTTPNADWSLPGLIATATRANVLARTAVILDEVGIGRMSTDLADPAARTLAERLAAKIGCTVDQVVACSHQHLDDSGERGHPFDEVRIGAATCWRTHLIFDTRRISPASLLAAPHHRLAWLHTLLPYCPESLELLIDECPSCRSKLGWRRARGIGVCEHCRAAVEHPTGERLPPELAEGYRGFAALAAGTAERRSAIMTGLAPALHGLPPLTLMLMTVALGRLFVLPDDDGRGDVRRFGPALLGRIVAAGFDLLGDWPTRLRARVGAEMAGLVERGHGEHRAFLAKVRALGDLRSTPDGQTALVRTAMPEIFEHASRALRIGRDVLGGAELSRLTGLSSAQLGLLRDGDALPFAVLREGERIGAQYSRAEAERLNSSLRSSHPSSRIERRLGLPHYAVEQAVCAGLLEMKDHPGAAALGLGLRIRDGSADDLEHAIMARTLRGPQPSDAMSLDRAVRIIGGRCKPWGVILSAAAAGALPFWIADGVDGAPMAARMLVRRGSIDRFLDVEFVRPAKPPFPFATSVSQRDACEILNLNSLLIRPAVDAGLLTMTPGPKKSFAHPLQEVLALAADIITAAEIAPRIGVRENNVRKWIADNLNGVGSAVVGWPRAAVLRGLEGARMAPVR